MVRKSKSEDLLSSLRAMEASASLSPEDLAQLRQCALSTVAIVAAKAAGVAAKRNLGDFGDCLAGAFVAWLDRGPAADKGCIAKLALAIALNEMGHTGREAFLRGIHYSQPEPAYRGSSDTAGRVRAECALGLARTRYPRAHQELAVLLADSEGEARDGAVRALAYLGTDAAESLLRLKALCGDKVSTITGQCLLALMRINPLESLEFVSSFVGCPDPAVAEEAALALAESRHERAFVVLQEHWSGNPDPDFREMLLTPIALTQRAEACDLIAHVIALGPLNLAIAASAPLRHNSTWQTRIAQAVTTRNTPELTREYQRVFNTT